MQNNPLYKIGLMDKGPIRHTALTNWQKPKKLPYKKYERIFYFFFLIFSILPCFTTYEGALYGIVSIETCNFNF